MGSLFRSMRFYLSLSMYIYIYPLVQPTAICLSLTSKQRGLNHQNSGFAPEDPHFWQAHSQLYPCFYWLSSTLKMGNLPSLRLFKIA